MNVITVFHRAGTWLVVYKSVFFNNFLACWPSGSKKMYQYAAAYILYHFISKDVSWLTYIVTHQD
jgi:hypothetical protein